MKEELKDIVRVIQMNSSDFKQFIKLSGFNDLCKLQKTPKFMSYVNHGNRMTKLKVQSI